MRTKLRISIVSVLVALAGGALVTTTASSQTVLRVVLSPQAGLRAAVIDINNDGLRLGDRIAARGPLFDETQTDRLGTAYLHCHVHRRIIQPDRGLWNCNYVLELKGGDVVLQGLDPRGPGAYDVAVLGGTGAYAGASGAATFEDVGTDADGYTDMTISLSG